MLESAAFHYLKKCTKRLLIKLRFASFTSCCNLLCFLIFEHKVARGLAIAGNPFVQLCSLEVFLWRKANNPFAYWILPELSYTPVFSMSTDTQLRAMCMYLLHSLSCFHGVFLQKGNWLISIWKASASLPLVWVNALICLDWKKIWRRIFSQVSFELTLVLIDYL